MKNYINLLKKVLREGHWVEHKRTQSRTLMLWGGTLSYDLWRGFPLLTQRKVPYKNMISELLWFLSGSTDNTVLKNQKNPVWRLWDLGEQDIQGWGSDKDGKGNPVFVGSCGPIYGAMWRKWPLSNGETFDQIAYVIDTLRNDPASRRIYVSCWNPEFLPDETMSPQANVLRGRQALAPCHVGFQLGTREMKLWERIFHTGFSQAGSENAEVLLSAVFGDHCQSKIELAQKIGRWVNPKYEDRIYRRAIRRWVKKDPRRSRIIQQLLDAEAVPRRKLNMVMYARSQDLPLGTVFNIPSYSLLLHLIAEQVRMTPGTYVHDMGDMHIYENQLDNVKLLVKRRSHPLPKLKIRKGVSSIFDYVPSDIAIEGYKAEPAIKFELTK